jgi:DNA-binding transcriptional LysR family regulator
MELDLDCIASFLVLVEEKHYGRAAGRLHVTSPALTKRMQRLERQLGVALIARGAVGFVGLTAAGTRFAHAAGPLLAHASAARRSAQEGHPRRTLRLGVPGAVGEYPSRLELAIIATELHCSHPEVRLLCRGVPFTALASCLVDDKVDVLWTAGEVRHPGLVSSALAEVVRLGVVGAVHGLADAPGAPVEDFAALPMLFHPDVDADWMALWYLGDVRPARDAHLVQVVARDMRGVLARVARGPCVTTLPAQLAGMLLPSLRSVPLLGAPAVTFHAVWRQIDRRDSIPALVEALRGTAARWRELVQPTPLDRPGRAAHDFAVSEPGWEYDGVAG